MKSVSEYTLQSCQELLDRDESCFIMITAKPCTACDLAKPIVEQLAHRFSKEINFLYVDDTKGRESLKHFKQEGQGWPLYVLKNQQGNITVQNINRDHLEKAVLQLL